MGIGLAVAAATYCVLAYIFIWPPVVTHVSHHWDFSACINNMRSIDAAIYQYALEHNKHAGDPVTLQDITPYIRLNAQGEIPKCPMTRATYILTAVGEPPRCPQSTNQTELQIERVGFFRWDENRRFHAYHILP